MVKTIDMTKSDRELRELVREVCRKGDQYILQESDQPMAVLIDYAGWSDVQKGLEIIRHQREARTKLQAIRDEVQLQNPDVDEEELERDVEEAIHSVRSTRT